MNRRDRFSDVPRRHGGAEKQPAVDLGDTADTGDEVSVDAVAGEALGGHRAVYVAADGRAKYANVTDVSTRNACGITANAADENAVVRIVLHGLMVEQSWSWAPGLPIYVGDNGLLTQVPPNAGYNCPIAMAISSTQIDVHVRYDIGLA